MMPPPPPVPPALVHDVAEKQATALDLEFEQLWETTSDLSEEDLERMKQFVLPLVVRAELMWLGTSH